ncbi:hypothetical protein [Nocardia arizonensis]|uniref:hypothetical protein n=1 Tax=Nocardia arizonensis TaxID=1141647 RepID=UPI0006D2C66A|nr:hypothetical protein [Nocardia arizonensis]
MASPEIQSAIEEWARGYTPTEWAQRHFRSNYRMELQAALARLILLVDGEGDELAVLPSVQSFAVYVARLDERLRSDLAGDRHVDTGRASDRPTTKGQAA